ncbi:MAG: ABC transporter substrate-binding protein [Myxococcaceae bacterium]
MTAISSRLKSFVTVAAATVLALAPALVGCKAERPTAPPAPGQKVQLVFKHQPLWGDPAPFRALLDQFERDNPDVDVIGEYIPNASDLAHQFYVTSLEGGAADFDVMVIDVIWTPEFARAGWIADLSRWFPPGSLREDFLPGPVDAVVVDDRTWAVPWFVDVGLMFYRTDLVPRAPRTYAELESFAREAMARDPSLSGYVWQGRQYEGLNCNVFEAVWGHGGSTLEGNRLQLDTPATREALTWMRGLLEKGISPPSITAAAEEETRRMFQDGRVVFMRNWPYAWAEAQQPGSPIRGRVGYAALPTENGEPGFGTLGGWQLAVNRNIPEWRQALAAKFIAHMTSPRAQLQLALHYARNPPRRSVYEMPELKEGSPFIASLLPMIERARPRPVTPWYVLVSDVLQGEFSAAIAGLRSPEVSLSRAQKLADHLMEGTQ